MTNDNPLAGRDLLRLLDLTPEEFGLVLDTAAQQKADWAAGVHETPCKDESVAIILEKPSLRTRSSFEIGTYRLGAHPLVMSDNHSAFSRGETVHDTTLVLERFVDAIVIRTFEQAKVEEIAKWAKIPVVNALTDDFHPCQGLADALTIREHKGALEGLVLAYVGDGNNMSNTYVELGALAGMHVRIGCPSTHPTDAAVVEEARAVAQQTGAREGYVGTSRGGRRRVSESRRRYPNRDGLSRAACGRCAHEIAGGEAFRCAERLRCCATRPFAYV